MILIQYFFDTSIILKLLIRLQIVILETTSNYFNEFVTAENILDNPQ